MSPLAKRSTLEVLAVLEPWNYKRLLESTLPEVEVVEEELLLVSPIVAIKRLTCGCINKPVYAHGMCRGCYMNVEG